MMFSDDTSFRRFRNKNFCIYAITNLAFNILIPYAHFREQPVTYLFEGPHPLVQFALPMAFFLPFLIFCDAAKKTTDFLHRRHRELPSKNGNYWLKPALRRGFMLGTLSFSAVLGVMLLLICFRADHFPVTFALEVSLLLGLLASGLALYTAHKAIKMVLKACSLLRPEWFRPG